MVSLTLKTRIVFPKIPTESAFLENDSLYYFSLETNQISSEDVLYFCTQQLYLRVIERITVNLIVHGS
jgi:hypothetical protein